jgi:hypothetical protein
MSTNSQDQELDLGKVFHKMGGSSQYLMNKIFNLIFFIKKKAKIISVLFVLGIITGFFLDKNVKVYNHEIIVAPNFGSVEYLYSKINLLNAKKKEKDTLFISSLGIKNVKEFNKIEIEPIIDVYKFISKKPENFDLIKLMAEDGSINKVVKDETTSKNYPYHLIKFSTSKSINKAEIVDPLLKFLNDSDYFTIIQKQYFENTTIKITENDSTITQINQLLNNFNTISGNQKNDKLIYYNENNQLSDIIKAKDELIIEQGNLRINLLNYDKIVKDISTTTNIINTKGTKGKLKIVLPFMFVFLFIFGLSFINFYREQLKKRNIS